MHAYFPVCGLTSPHHAPLIKHEQLFYAILNSNIDIKSSKNEAEQLCRTVYAWLCLVNIMWQAFQ
jgi:hypothetical protein